MYVYSVYKNEILPSNVANVGEKQAKLRKYSPQSHNSP